MECYKDEARRAMDVAEKKLSENDYFGAKKYVNKAQNLYPKLDGLKQVLMMIHVYISASKFGKGEADWYGVLGVDPLADDEAVKKQYKKLALLLHPDKNKCKGAEEAFKLISEAWCLLSDKAKRSAYDQKWKLKTGMHKPASNTGNQKARGGVYPSAKARSNKPAGGMQKPPNPFKPASSNGNGNRNAKDGVDPSAKAKSNKPAGGMPKPPNRHKPASSYGNGTAKDGVDPSAKARSNNPSGGMPKPPNPHKPASSYGNGTANDGVDPSAKARSNKPKPPPADLSQKYVGMFWTMCNECKTQCEFVRDYRLNKVILCPNCGVSFTATEITQWSSFVMPVPNSPQQQQRSAQTKARNKTKKVPSGSWINISPSTSKTQKTPQESATTNNNTNEASSSSPSASGNQKTSQESAKNQEATNNNTNGASSSSPSVSATTKTQPESFASPVINVSSSTQPPEQWSTQNQSTSQNTSGGTHSETTLTDSFSLHCSIPLATSFNGGNTENQEQERSKRAFEESQETTILKKHRTM